MSVEEKVYNTVIKLKHIEDLDLLAEYVKSIIVKFKEETKNALGPSCSYVEDEEKLRSLLYKEKLDEEDVKEGASN